MSLWRFTPWCACCEGEAGCCSEDGSVSPPLTITVTITGMSGVSTVTCEAIDGTYVLDLVAEDNDCCEYAANFEFDDPLGTYDLLIIEASVCRSQCAASVKTLIERVASPPIPSTTAACYTTDEDCDEWPCPLNLSGSQEERCYPEFGYCCCTPTCPDDACASVTVAV